MNAQHIIHIREALWKRPERGACVMVGAGFSKQAEAGQRDGMRPPSWKDLAGQLQTELRCGRSTSVASSPAESVTARDCSRLAQQYKATFGQSALDSFLLDRVPDGEPGTIHRRLLRLPWADVFTTNWDTLLEEAATTLFERTYDSVLQSPDLATTVAPRIVKLHGSFPSSRPFIITEEDYRTYPTRFAPLVNTVQQALMESTFLLVGFSGDDPNFLHWCGWVRDHLGPAAPKLYLAGLLGLDRPNRLMLEERGVIPIDLASEVSGAPSREERHRRAIQWILDSLEEGETREERWPLPPRGHTRRETHGIPLPIPPSAEPRETLGAPDESADAKPLTEQVEKVVADWRHNRRVYPGWPILPFSKHSFLASHTRAWTEAILKTAPDLDPPHRLAVVRELIERIELLMDPLTLDVAKEATNTLAAVEGVLAAADIPHSRRQAIEEDAIALMLTLLTDSRHDLNQTGFEHWEQRLAGVVPAGSPAFHRLQHERCLWSLWMRDFTSLAGLLTAWQTDDADPMWSLRKAALLVESGETDWGQRVALESIQRAERAWSREGRVQTASRLGWALQWRQALSWSLWWENTRKGRQSRQPETDLWARLAPYDADARSDLEAYARQLTRTQQDDSHWTFDLGRVNRFSLSNTESRQYFAARRLTRLLELGGLPSTFPGVRVASDHVDQASRVFAPHTPALAARLQLVGGSGKETTWDAVISQTNLGRMSDQEALELFLAAQRARDYFLERWTQDTSAGDFLLERAEHAIEVMSRCVARCGVARGSEVFEWAVNYRRAQRWQSISFHCAVTRLWWRSWKWMDLESRSRVVPQILSAPIPEGRVHEDRDPVELLFAGIPRVERSAAEEATWASGVRRICEGLRGDKYARRVAVNRLCWVARERLLTQHEDREVAGKLWETVPRESKGLPAVGAVDDWVCLVLPEPEAGMAEQRFRAKWIGPHATAVTEDTWDQTIRNVAAAWNPDPAHCGDHALELATDEQQWFWGTVAEWLRRESERRVIHGTSRDRAVSMLLDVLMLRRAPASVLQLLAKNARPVAGTRHPIVEQWGSPENEYLMLAASAAFGGGDSRDAEDRLRLGSRSPDGRVSLAAWNALRWWIRASVRSGAVAIHPPSLGSVRDIGIAIGSVQQCGLVGTLRVACTVYESGNPEFIKTIHPRIIRGLRRLRSALEYRTSAADRQSAEELPLRRHWCVWLAWVMTDADHGQDDVVRSWIEAGDSDPLCLVRLVREWHAVSNPAEDPKDSP